MQQHQLPGTRMPTSRRPSPTWTISGPAARQPGGLRPNSPCVEAATAAAANAAVSEPVILGWLRLDDAVAMGAVHLRWSDCPCL